MEICGPQYIASIYMYLKYLFLPIFILSAVYLIWGIYEYVISRKDIKIKKKYKKIIIGIIAFFIPFIIIIIFTSLFPCEI